MAKVVEHQAMFLEQDGSRVAVESYCCKFMNYCNEEVQKTEDNTNMYGAQRYGGERWKEYICVGHSHEVKPSCHVIHVYTDTAFSTCPLCATFCSEILFGQE